MRKLKISYSDEPLLTLTRSRCWLSKMVYILSANKYLPYKDGRLRTFGWSSILYIGTTKKGAGRPAASAVNKAGDVFYNLHGVKTIEVFIATCVAHNKKFTWKRLEAALLDAFGRDTSSSRSTTTLGPSMLKGCLAPARWRNSLPNLRSQIELWQQSPEGLPPPSTRFNNRSNFEDPTA